MLSKQCLGTGGGVGMTRHNRKLTIFWKWMVSYACVILAVLLLMVPLTTNLISIIDTRNAATNYAATTQLQSRIDDALEDINQLIVSVGVNERVLRLNSNLGELRPFHQNLIIEVMGDLRTSYTGHRLAASDGLYVYFNNHAASAYILGMFGKYDVPVYYKMVQSQTTSITPEAYVDLLERIHFFEPVVLLSPRQDTQLEIWHTIATNNANIPQAQAVVRIDMNELRGMLSEGAWTESSRVVLLDGNMRPILAVGAGGQPIKAEDGLPEGAPIAPGEVKYYGGEAYLSVRSTHNDFTYVYITPENAYRANAAYLRTLVFVVTLLSVLLGALTLFVVARWNYRPIVTISGSVQKALGIDAQNPRTLGNLENNVDELILDNRRKNTLVREQQETLRPFLLLRILKGSLGDAYTFEDACKAYGIHFESNRFVVLLFFANIGEDADGMAHNEASHAIQTIIDELPGKRSICYCLDDEGIVACLVNLREQESEFFERLRVGLSDILSVFKQRYGVSLIVAVSGAHTDSYGIAQAYKEAVEAMDYMLIISAAGEGTAFYTDLPTNVRAKGAYTYTLEQQQQIMNFMRAKDFDGACVYINGIIACIISQRMSVPMARCTIFAIINTMIDAMKHLSATVVGSFIDELDPLNRLLGCNTLPLLERQTNSLLQEIKAYAIEKRAEDLNHRISDVLSYIHEHYDNPELNVSMVAYEFKLTIGYISRFFKKSTGEGLSEYISRVRLDKAKEFLLRDVASIKEVASAVGYANSNALIRAFKHSEGITPGRFRAIHTGQEK